jgi:hypothetical protein
LKSNTSTGSQRGGLKKQKMSKEHRDKLI